jgi:hypothetical protein
MNAGERRPVRLFFGKITNLRLIFVVVVENANENVKNLILFPWFLGREFQTEKII